MNYGMPYMGSKNRIARDIVEQLPSAEYFVDLFCGGCAVTHAAMLSGKYKKFIVNDIAPDMPRLFVDAINGKYRNEKRWISRENFERLKDTDTYVRTCWSFGNDGHSYIYGRKIEPWKKALHYARVLGDFSLLKRDFGIDTDDASRQNIAKNADTWKLRDKLKYSLRRLQSLQSLENLKRLQSLESMESNLQIFSLDYQSVEIPHDSVVYCDIPYRGTKEYKDGCFDYSRFYDWLRTRDYPVWVSEYAMPDDFFSVWSRDKVSTCGTHNNRKTTEHLFLHKRFSDEIFAESLPLFERKDAVNE
jgi:site-specific DNA-adenine methylase